MTTPIGPYELCEWLQAGILAELQACNRGPVTTTYPGVGLVAWDDCCGQLVVTPERIYRSEIFPQEAITDEQCDAGDIAVAMVATLVRCVPTPDDRGHLPTAAALAAAHKIVLDDAAVVWAAMSAPINPEWSRAALSQQFTGGQGGCIAIDTRVIIGVSSDLWCLDCS